ncbi:hypothetical protein [Butyrivibrio sp. XPD2002]|uniref:hypothetical protein n=1 Tax=Butyrivibrio sp. XPD2002 TaxID=1280665 RepID=UPI000412D622|nr:hypothetical protein [Butyrivibrio sp. XPD2002]
MIKKKTVIKGANAPISIKDRKRMEKAIKKAKKDGEFPTTAQNTIPFRAMYKNGLCQLEGYRFSKSINYDDINYVLKDSPDKETVFRKLSDLYNFFTEDVHLQMTYMNTRITQEELNKALIIEDTGDSYDELRDELTDILFDKERKGNKGIRKNRYLTYTIEEDNPVIAAKKTKDLDEAIQANLKKAGLKAESHVLDGTERLRVLHAAMHPEGNDKFRFNWNLLSKNGLSTKDFIAPISFRFPVNGKYFRMGDIYGKVSLLSLDCPRVDDRLITDLLSIDTPIIVSIHIDPIDRVKAKKYIQKRNMQLNSTKIKEQKHASNNQENVINEFEFDSQDMER